MDPTKKRQQPDSGFNEDPSSGDGDVSNWRAGLSKRVRFDHFAVIAQSIHKNHSAETPAIIATARRAEGEFYKEATSKHDYQTRVTDYIQSIPRTPRILQAAPVDLTSQMKRLDNSQEKTLASILSHANTILSPQQEQQQQQPMAGSLLPQPQQPQQQHWDFNELSKEIQELLDLEDLCF